MKDNDNFVLNSLFGNSDDDHLDQSINQFSNDIMDNQFLNVDRVANAARIVYTGINVTKFNSMEYQDLYKYYQQNKDIRKYIDAIASSFDLKILGIDSRGVYLVPKYQSIFWPRADDFQFAKTVKNKQLAGIIMMTIAAMNFPKLRNLEDDLYMGVPLRIKDIISKMAFTIKNIKSNLELFEQSPVKDSDELQTIFQIYDSLKDENSTKKGRSSIEYHIKAVLDELERSRLIVRNEDIYHPTPRFKVMMKELIQDPYYINFMKLREFTEDHTNDSGNVSLNINSKEDVS